MRVKWISPDIGFFSLLREPGKNESCVFMDPGSRGRKRRMSQEWKITDSEWRKMYMFP